MNQNCTQQSRQAALSTSSGNAPLMHIKIVFGRLSHPHAISSPFSVTVN